MSDPSELERLRLAQQRLLARLDESEARFRASARRLWQLQENDRRRVARELHDGVGQNLTALKHRLALLGSTFAPRDVDARAHLDSAIALCTRTLQDTRDLARLLRPQILDDLGLEPALRWLVRSLFECGDTVTDLRIAPLPRLEAEIETLVFRTAQEALSNAARHAGAGRVDVQLGSGDGVLHLTVCDDGRGCDAGVALRAGGSGLGGMRERLALYGGRLMIESEPGAGMALRAWIPFAAGAAAPPVAPR